jgi:hypothetical protein
VATSQVFFDSQVTGEVKKYTTDFTAFLPAGASIPSAGVAASMAHTFSPSGSIASSGSCATSASGNYVTFATAALQYTGQYRFTVGASLSDGQYRDAIYYVRVDA